MMLASSINLEDFPIKRESIPILVGVVRDAFCVRLRSFFDKRDDVHSLTKYFQGPEITTLKTHPVTMSCIQARHKNVAHFGKEYVKWPDVEQILSSNLPDLLERIKLGLILYRNYT